MFTLLVKKELPLDFYSAGFLYSDILYHFSFRLFFGIKLGLLRIRFSTFTLTCPIRLFVKSYLLPTTRQLSFFVWKKQLVGKIYINFPKWKKIAPVDQVINGGCEISVLYFFTLGFIQ